MKEDDDLVARRVEVPLLCMLRVRRVEGEASDTNVC